MDVFFKIRDAKIIQNEAFSWMTVFVPCVGQSVKIDHYAVPAVRYTASFDTMDRRMIARDTVSFFWSVSQLDPATGLSSVSVQAFATVSISESLSSESKMRAVPMHYLTNDSKEVVATLSYSVRFRNPQTKRLRDVAIATSQSPVSCLQSYGSRIHKWIADHFPPTRQNPAIKDGRSALRNTMAYMPFLGELSSVPMWVFSAASLPEANAAEANCMVLRRFIEIAVFRLGLPYEWLDYKEDQIDVLESSSVIEIACEAACFLSQCMTYRLDKIGDTSVDLWSLPMRYPCIEKAGGDCEDLQSVTLHIILMLRESVASGVDTPLMSRIRRELAPYEFCNCIGTLRLSDTDTVWHSYVVGFERDWLLSRGRSPMRLDCLILESTASVTSHPRFQSPLSRLDAKIETMIEDQIDRAGALRKTPASSIQSGTQYLHTVVAFSPCGAVKGGCVEFFFSDNRTGQDMLGIDLAELWHDRRAARSVTIHTPVLPTDQHIAASRAFHAYQPPNTPLSYLLHDCKELPELPWATRDKLMSANCRANLFYFRSNVTRPEEKRQCNAEMNKYVNQLNHDTGSRRVHQEVLCPFPQIESVWDVFQL